MAYYLHTSAPGGGIPGGLTRTYLAALRVADHIRDGSVVRDALAAVDADALAALRDRLGDPVLAWLVQLVGDGLYLRTLIEYAAAGGTGRRRPAGPAAPPPAAGAERGGRRHPDPAGRDRRERDHRRAGSTGVTSRGSPGRRRPVTRSVVPQPAATAAVSYGQPPVSTTHRANSHAVTRSASSPARSATRRANPRGSVVSRPGRSAGAGSCRRRDRRRRASGRSSARARAGRRGRCRRAGPWRGARGLRRRAAASRNSASAVADEARVEARRPRRRRGGPGVAHLMQRPDPSVGLARSTAAAGGR